MRLLETRKHETAVARLVDGATGADPANERLMRRARAIVRDVRRRGDAALCAWSRRLDGFDAPQEVSLRELRDGWRATRPEVRRAIRLAVARTSRVALDQLPTPASTYSTPGVRIENRIEPLERVGCYVPGGRFPLVSSVIMTVVPARIAGVQDITVACPAVTPEICCAALVAGATRVIRMGGAQAIAALAYGTESIARVNKIVGPGSAWVAAAKSIVAADCAIDFHAGPSEIVVWSELGNPAWIAGDLIAQAEHDPDARAVCITTNVRLARDLRNAVGRLAKGHAAARRSLRRNGAVILATSRTEAADLVSRFAPEHVVCDNRQDAALVRHAGTVFVGDWSAQALGDYVTGSNHVLPTRAAARGRGGLSAADFVRTFTVQTVTRSGFMRLSQPAITLAMAEGLRAHAESIRRRFNDGRKRRR